MAGQTIAEKLLSRAVGRRVETGELVICAPDVALGTDGSIPMALNYLAQMQDGVPRPPHAPDRLFFALDHYGEASGQGALKLQQTARTYAQQHGIRVFEEGQGVGHQLMLEHGIARPGLLLVGADSHSTSYGAMNAFATGIGSSDLAGIMLCGSVWLKVPETIRIELTGQLAAQVSAKDVALHLAQMLGADGATYQVLEFQGPGIATLDMDDRIVLANMSVEMGAKAGLFPFDATTREWLGARGLAEGADYRPEYADTDARYIRHLSVALDLVTPKIALPHRVDNVVDLAEVEPTRVDMVYLGTCTGGRVKDYREALEGIRAHGGIKPGVQVVVTPASEAVEQELRDSGLLDEFQRYGASIQPPGCGSCCGTCGVKPGNDINVVSTANRNFRGRMGNAASSIFLASPRVCGIAAATGELRRAEQA